MPNTRRKRFMIFQLRLLTVE